MRMTVRSEALATTAMRVEVVAEGAQADLDRLKTDPAHQPTYWWQSGNGSWYLKVTDVPITRLTIGMSSAPTR